MRTLTGAHTVQHYFDLWFHPLLGENVHEIVNQTYLFHNLWNTSFQVQLDLAKYDKGLLALLSLVMGLDLSHSFSFLDILLYKLSERIVFHGLTC